MNDSSPARFQGRSRLVWAAVAAVLVVLVVWLAVRGGSDSGAEASSGTTTAATPTVTPSGTASAFPSTTVGADGQPLPSKKPGQTVPTAVVKPGKLPKPVRTPLRSTAQVGDGVEVKVTKIEAVQGKGRGPGETSGPSLRFTIEVVNGSDKPLETVASTVTASYGGNDTPATDVSAPGGRPLPDQVAPGKSATGVFLFRIPPDQRDQVKVEFTYNVEIPRVIFSGSA